MQCGSWDSCLPFLKQRWRFHQSDCCKWLKKIVTQVSENEFHLDLPDANELTHWPLGDKDWISNTWFYKKKLNDYLFISRWNSLQMNAKELPMISQQDMARCCQARSHWPNSIIPYGIIKGQWFNYVTDLSFPSYAILNSCTICDDVYILNTSNWKMWRYMCSSIVYQVSTWHTVFNFGNHGIHEKQCLR